MSAVVIQFTPRDLPTDGGKARILAHRYAINLSEPVFDWRREDLTMDHVDNGMPSDAHYNHDKATRKC